MDIDDLAAKPRPAAEPDFGSGFADEVGLEDFAVNGLRQLSGHLDKVFAFLGDGLRQTENVGNLADDALHLALKVVVIVDDAQVGMARPGAYDFLVKFAGYAQSLLIGLLVAGGVGGGGVVLLGPVGCRHQVEHSVVAFAQLVAVDASLRGHIIPLLG